MALHGHFVWMGPQLFGSYNYGSIIIWFYGLIVSKVYMSTGLYGTYSLGVSVSAFNVEFCLYSTYVRTSDRTSQLVTRITTAITCSISFIEQVCSTVKHAWARPTEWEGKDSCCDSGRKSNHIAPQMHCYLTHAHHGGSSDTSGQLSRPKCMVWHCTDKTWHWMH